MDIDAQHRLVVMAQTLAETFSGFSAPQARAPRSVAIVGAGPAGLIAAEVLASAGHQVTVYDRMASPARKFLMAGRGGLNLTHSEAFETFLNRYQEDRGAVRRAVMAFPPSAVIDWANSLGAETFIGSSGRVFPRAMKASPLLRAWLQRLGKLGVVLKTRHTWTGFADGGGLTFTGPQGEVLLIKPDAAILALGGASWPRLGSDGGWVKPFQTAGISVTPLQASNCGVAINWSAHMAKFEGLPLKQISVTCAGTTRHGEAVITKFGLEGGVIYALSHDIRKALAAGPVSITVDLRAGLPLDDLVDRIASSPPKSTTTNILRKGAGLSSAATGIVREPGPLPRDPQVLAGRIKALPLVVTAMACLDRAISTAGGIDQSALDPNFMLAQRPGVFVAGEMLDWDAPTGGYLLQASFATGVAAARGALTWLAPQ